MAHGRFGRVLAVWDGSASATGATERVAPAPQDTAPRRVDTPVGLPETRPASPVEALRRHLRRTVSSGEELVFLLMFLAFVGFAVHWLVLLLG